MNSNHRIFYCARTISCRLQLRGLRNLSSTATSRGGLVVFLGDDYFNMVSVVTKTVFGPVGVEYNFFDNPPAFHAFDWEDIVEFSAKPIADAPIFLDSEDTELDVPENFFATTDEGYYYRVRIYSKNRDSIPNEVWLDPSDSPVEVIRCDVWTQPPQAPRVWKMESREAKEWDEYFSTMTPDSLF